MRASVEVCTHKVAFKPSCPATPGGASGTVSGTASTGGVKSGAGIGAANTSGHDRLSASAVRERKRKRFIGKKPEFGETSGAKMFALYARPEPETQDKSIFQ